jgi:hypothetical protein
MRNSFTTYSLDYLVDGFTGREGMKGYNSEKPIKLYELNRDFVWDDDTQEGLIVSILTGYPIPTITVCNGAIVDGGNRTTTLWRFKNNEFNVKIDGVEYDYETMLSNRNISRKWDGCQVPIQVITEATSDEISNIYENLNKGKPLSFGQLLENRKHVTFVDAALSIINKSQNNAQYPYRELTSKVWNKTFKKSKTRTEIAFAFQLLAASMYGPNHFKTSFSHHVGHILITEKSQIVDFTNLGKILAMLNEVDPDNIIPRAKKSFCFRKFAGVIIHDMWDQTLSSEDFKKKWKKMFDKAYNDLEDKNIRVLFNIGTERATSGTRLKAISDRVQSFLDGKLDLGISDGSIYESDEDTE